MPKSTFMSVLLPAPFSPTSAWIVPARTVRETPLRTRFPSYSLVMFRSSRPGAVMGAGSSRSAVRPLVRHVVEHHQPLVALWIVLVEPHRAASFLLEVALHRGRVAEVGLVIDRIHQQ